MTSSRTFLPTDKRSKHTTSTCWPDGNRYTVIYDKDDQEIANSAGFVIARSVFPDDGKIIVEAMQVFYETGLTPYDILQHFTWRPIADAPKDGTPYLATNGRKFWVENRPSEKHIAGEWNWSPDKNHPQGGRWAGASSIRGATHFMMIPPISQGESHVQG